ncbi:unnamed protein product [Chondrus crispus]|uniref:Galactosyltransferase C-terminal domain-containing protein n=1 Tax=Chondrus crispus TaxID=2769 RepID=R7QTQ6_CHOCR|nr:unnamed protein product [Chondrus crispus]CDF41083.1 unnamed protein product [Chondrus crispus]|eukprot:XP_005711377.1 unnamed protein product [Chondrus crispus]
MALESWLRVPNARQVVVVDWSSDPPLQSVVDRVVANFNSSVDDLPHVQVVPVEGERDWVLTRAYNLAFRHARFDNVFKLDCDYIVKPTAVKAHLLPRKQDVFFTGYYMNARDANEMHLNGALVISKKRFWAVGGYDERIQTYGYDDEELYKRLTKSGMRKMNISYDEIRHEHHSDDMRAQESVKFPRAQIDMNSLLLEKINSPWGSGYRKSDYKRQGGSEGGLRATYVPKALHTLVGKKTRDELWKTALGRRLRQDFVVPWALVGAMDIVQAEKALWNFCIRKGNSTYDEVTHTGQRVRFVLVHVQNGLGNRLRVLASGLSFAERTRREPIVVWEKDVHFGGSFSDIFDGKHAEFAPRGQYDDAWNDIEFYNYMIEENDGKVIVDDEEKSIYFKSDSVMKTPITSWESENVQLQRLRVNSDITARAAQITNRSDFKNVGGVHIRNRSLENDIVGVKDNSGLYHDDDAAEIKKWRATTKYTNFVSEMEDLLESGTVDRFFVASDTVGVLRTMQNLFPEGKVFYLDRDCDDRGGECEQYAMADLLVLSRTKVLLGSTWSSFSEAAMRLGGPKALLAGTDFGELPTSPSSAPSTDQHR